MMQGRAVICNFTQNDFATFTFAHDLINFITNTYNEINFKIEQNQYMYHENYTHQIKKKLLSYDTVTSTYTCI